MNDRPFEHNCQYGTKFRCERCDFKEPVIVTNAPQNPIHFASDVSEMIGFHATNIWPQLNGFSGYDCIQYKFAKPERDSDEVRETKIFDVIGFVRVFSDDKHEAATRAYTELQSAIDADGAHHVPHPFVLDQKIVIREFEGDESELPILDPNSL